MRLPSFKTPPINEVVFGVSFDPPPNWTIGHVGDFWQFVKKDYPRCQHASPTGDSEFLDSSTGLPLPRVWFINESDDELLQIQSGRFWRNWRRMGDAADYPNYDNLKKRFFVSWDIFNDYCNKSELGPPVLKGAELSYINHIYGNDTVSIPNNIDEVLVDIGWIKQEPKWLSMPSDFRVGRRFSPDPKHGSVNINYSTARKNETDLPLVVFDIRVQTSPNWDLSNNVSEWFDEAHERVIEAFCSLTTKWAQETLWSRMK